MVNKENFLEGMYPYCCMFFHPKAQVHLQVNDGSFPHSIKGYLKCKQQSQDSVALFYLHVQYLNKPIKSQSNKLA